ncbi:MAG TPA: pyridoxamine 5'-phosphate oxidase family protein [Longimicrobiaceae bacterium]|nr:pyridoxamine 5'-phosphate oxidase family protein [Longimicrobiaceae bacterium]
MHYVFVGGWIYGRTAPGAKLTAVSHNRWVAFEVDEIEEMFAWRSVVVRGGFHVLSPDGPEHDRAGWQRRIELLQRILPSTFQDDDPVPFRNVLFRIAVQEASGREARPGSPASRPAFAG